MLCSSTQHRSLSELFTGSFLVEIQGRIQKIQKGVAGRLAHLSSIDTFYFSHNSITIIQNFKEKGLVALPSAHS